LLDIYSTHPLDVAYLSGLALTGAVCCQPSLFAHTNSAHASMANSLDAANQCVSIGHSDVTPGSCKLAPASLAFSLL